MQLTPHQAKYIAHELTLQHSGGGIDRLSQALFNASVDLNPHQIDAAVFALRSPLSKGVLLADLWPAINRFPQKPLFYNIAWKTVISQGLLSR